LAAQIEARRGLLSVQEFTVQALVAACEGSMVEQALRAEIERLHVTLRAFGHQPTAELRASEVPQTCSGDRRLGW
jgi:hypothetical protein